MSYSSSLIKNTMKNKTTWQQVIQFLNDPVSTTIHYSFLLWFPGITLHLCEDGGNVHVTFSFHIRNGIHR